MIVEDKNKNNKTTDQVPGNGLEPKVKKERKKVSFAGGSKRKDRRRQPREAREFEQTIVSIRRVVRVVKGGRRFSFSVAMVIGDKKGKVGFGLGKSSDTASAIEGAVKAARKSMVTIPLTKNRSIRREVNAKYCGSSVFIQPAPGLGLSAGGAVRTVLSLAGVTDVNAKVLSRSKNGTNNARAALRALLKIK